MLKKHLTPQKWNQIMGRSYLFRSNLDRRCSKKICKIRTFNLRYPDSPEIEVDICYGCDQVWFDLNEIEQLNQSPELDIEAQHSDDILAELGKIEVHNGQAIPRHLNYKIHALDISIKRVSESFKLYGAKAWLGFLGFPAKLNNRVKTTPLCTYSLMLAISFVSIYTFHFNPDLINTGGFLPNEALRYFGLNSITSFFFHGDYGHLLGNLYTLYVFGDNIEDKSRKTFLILSRNSLFSSIYVLLLNTIPRHGICDLIDAPPICRSYV